MHNFGILLSKKISVVSPVSPALINAIQPAKKSLIPLISKPHTLTFSSKTNTENNTSSSQTGEDKPLTPDEIANLPRSIQRHYGDDFFDLSVTQQRYLLNNLQKIRRINDLVGNRLLQNKYNDDIDSKENNTVEFYLHPDGTISQLTLLEDKGESLLDELTLGTIESAHSQYPRPKQTTLIRIRVWILVK